MKKTVYINEFIKALENDFSEEGKIALFNYFTQYEQETGVEIELDRIAIRVEYTEYSDFEEFKADYPDIKSIEELKENFVYIPFSGGFIIQNQ